MPEKKLAAALVQVDWNKNVKSFLADIKPAKELANHNLRLAIWSRQFEIADRQNPALSFIREMQLAGQHVAALSALGLYKPAAAAMRSMVETALYYTYFRSHHSELASLVRNPDYWVGRSDLIDYHKKHTPQFSELQGQLGLLTRMNKWYSEISSIVHGQIPGAWVDAVSLAKTSNNKITQDIVIKNFCEGEDIIHRLFLCTAGRDLWDSFSTQSKKALLSGLPGETKKLLKLDSA